MMKCTLRIVFVSLLLIGIPWSQAAAISYIGGFKARPPIHILGNTSDHPLGVLPDQIRQAYHLPSSGGSGTIAIIGAYGDPKIGNDLNVFSKQFGLPACTTANGCFEKHMMAPRLRTDVGWALETSLDVEWVHAIAPNAKIMLVEAAASSGGRLLDAVDYARTRADVVAISMSWGGKEFAHEADYESHFTSDHSVTFFASSGDNGTGVNWPAASANVVAVGGTTLHFDNQGAMTSETAWSGSGGGVSSYIPQPVYQTDYAITRAGGMRAVPDVSYDADPHSGFSVYDSAGFQGKRGWFVLGGTSAGAPQWAAIKALGHSVDNAKFYHDKATDNHAQYFRDIISGSNGDCSYYCTAKKRYDYVTGLGSPLRINF